MSLLDAVYQETLLDHYKRPRNHGALDPHDARQEGVNPSCGDELTLYLRVEGGRISEVTFEGDGCAISQATASMMTVALRGRSLEDARRISDEFRAMLQGTEPAPELGDLALLASVARLPARIKCAALPWTTLEQALGSLPTEASPAKPE